MLLLGLLILPDNCEGPGRRERVLLQLLALMNESIRAELLTGVESDDTEKKKGGEIVSTAFFIQGCRFRICDGSGHCEWSITSRMYQLFLWLLWVKLIGL